MDVREIISFIGDLSVTALLILAGWGGLKKLWVWGWVWQRDADEKDEWKSLSLELLQTTKDSVSVTERVVAKAKEEAE